MLAMPSVVTNLSTAAMIARFTDFYVYLAVLTLYPC